MYISSKRLRGLVVDPVSKERSALCPCGMKTRYRATDWGVLNFVFVFLAQHFYAAQRMVPPVAFSFVFEGGARIAGFE